MPPRALDRYSKAKISLIQWGFKVPGGDDASQATENLAANERSLSSIARMLPELAQCLPFCPE